MEVQGKTGSRQEEQQVERLHLRLGEGGKKERYSSRIVPPPNPMAAAAEERKTAAKEKRLKVNEDTSHHKQI